MFQKRIIMGGLPRSGSSLVRSILNGHPELLAPRETSIFIHDFASLQGKSHKFFQRLSERIELPLDEVSQLCADAQSGVEYFDQLMLRWAESIGAEEAQVWLEKTPRNCLRYGSIAREHPGVKFLSTIRDGRDVCTSIFPGQTDYYCSVERYVEAVDAVLKFEHPDHLIIKYENFVTSQDENLRKILEFIGLDWADQMITSYADAPGRSKVSQIAEPVVTKYVERWRKPEHEDRVDEFYRSADAMRCLQLSGYDPAR